MGGNSKVREKGVEDNGEKKLIKLRQKVNGLYFNYRVSKRKIAKKEHMSRGFVIRWTQRESQDFSQDRRGWEKGNRRRWSKSVEKKLKSIHKDLSGDPKQFYIGATAIGQEWRKRYPGESVPPLRTIGKILSDLHLSGKRRRDRHKGAARYLCYPEYSVYNVIGRRVLEADFIGKKFIKGRTEPINFIGFSFKKEPKIRYYKRVEGQTAKVVMEQCKEFFDRFEKPDCIKVDNCLATIGSASGKRNLSRVMKFSLANEVVPIFAVPRKPFSQASIEGNNSVFSRKFWNKIEFRDVEEIDQKLEWFNETSLRYTGYKAPRNGHTRGKRFLPRVYFIRQVKGDEARSRRAFIEVLNEYILLPPAYINYFVLAEWNLKEESLNIYLEKEQQLKTIKKIPFRINNGAKNHEK